MRNVSLIMVGLALLSACSSSNFPPKVIKEKEQIQRIEKDLRAFSLELDRVAVVRMEHGGKHIEVSSMGTVSMPTDNSAGGNFTLLRINKAKDSLILYTRDGSDAYLLEAPFAKLDKGASFDFPVTQQGGEIEKQRIVIHDIIVK
jgi:hypothetical protein